MPKIKTKHFIDTAKQHIKTKNDQIPKSFFRALREMHEKKLAKKLTVDDARMMPSDVDKLGSALQEGALQKFSKNKYQTTYKVVKEMKHEARQAQLAESAEKEFAGKKSRLAIKEKMMERRASIAESYQGKEAQEKREAILEQDQRLLARAKQETELQEAMHANIKTSRMKTVRGARRDAFRDVLRGLSSVKHTAQSITPREKPTAPPTVHVSDLAV